MARRVHRTSSAGTSGSDSRAADWPASSYTREEIERVAIRNVLSSTAERLFFKDRESRFLAVSLGFLRDIAPGRASEDLIGRTDFDLFSDQHASQAFEDEQRVILTGEPMPARLELETYSDGRPDAWVATTKLPLYDADGKIVGTWGISRDVTAQVNDSLTGLTNRVALMDRLGHALSLLERDPGQVGLLFVDLDEFKEINDSLGHAVGDEVLVEVGRRLRVGARRADTVARVGGDEFVILCPSLTRNDEIRLICDRIVRELREPIALAGRSLSVTGSIGVAVTDDGELDPGELLRRADVALYDAKHAGRDRFEVFEEESQAKREPAAQPGGDLITALERAELFVLYQPLFRLADGAVIGAEALVRWRHPTRGVLLPADFVPYAERRGLIERIDALVLDAACEQLAEWRAQEGPWAEFAMSVNLSGRQLRHAEVVDRVEGALHRHGIEPSCLCLEITETAMLEELSAAREVLDALFKLGVRVALDDFGTGYSTVAHLQRLRADILKIDRSLVAQLGGRRDREIVAAVIAMAHVLGMTVLAEGIETSAQRTRLQTLECDGGQGFVFAPAVSADELAALRAANAVADP